MQEKIENNTKTIHRLAEYITKTGISFNKLALELGLSNSYFSKMIKNGGSIGSDIIENILRIHPDINVDWLLTGRGSMFRGDPQTFIKQQPNVVSPEISSGEAVAYYKLFEKKDEENKELLKRIGCLEERIRQLESQDKEPNRPSEISGVLETFTSGSSGDYGESLSPTRKPSDSKRSSAGKM